MCKTKGFTVKQELSHTTKYVLYIYSIDTYMMCVQGESHSLLPLETLSTSLIFACKKSVT